MVIAIATIMVILSAILIVISLLMSPDSNGFSGALVGSSDLELFKYSKEKGIKKVYKYTMLICGILLVALAIVLRFVMK